MNFQQQKNQDFNRKKISRRHVLIVIVIIAVIATIHALLLSGTRSGEKTVPAPAVVPAENAVPPPLPPPPPAPVTPPPAKSVMPWNYRGQRALPGALGKRFREGKARSGIVIDLNSRQVLWSRNPVKPVPVASLTKLMTALMVMEKIEYDPEFNWTTMLPVSAAAVNVEHRSGVTPGTAMPVGSLMQSMLMASHNDSALILAGAMADGDVRRFAARMNSRAKHLGLTSVNFNSPNGLPQGKQRINSLASAADICHICTLLMRYDKVMNICKNRYQTVYKIGRVFSTNRLLNPKKGKAVPGVIGFKTGYTKAAGFCLAFGVERNGRTVIGCVTGFQSSNERDIFCRELVEWAFKQK